MGSAKKSDEIVREIALPAQLLKKPLFDEDGTQWMIQEKEKVLFRFCVKRMFTVFKSQEIPLAKRIWDALKATATKAYTAWVEKSARPLLETFAKTTGKLFNLCITEGEKTFRKEFMEKLGAQGEKLFERILKERCEEIGKLWTKSEGKIATSSSGLLPQGSRFWWQAKTPQITYDLFCIEAPPQRRTVRIAGETRRLAFPWFCFLVCFRNGVFLGFHAFYRSESLKNENDRLAFPNLPNIFKTFPHKWCLGGSQPSITLKDPLWHQKLIDHFWASEFWFYNEGHDVMTYWKDARERIPEVATLKQWEQLSEKEPKKMLTLPWKPVDKPLGEFARLLLAQALKDENKKHKKALEEQEQTRQALIRRFREQLEEELHFLGAHLVIPPKLETHAKEFVEREFDKISERLQETLEEQCETIVDQAEQAYLAD